MSPPKEIVYPTQCFYIIAIISVSELVSFATFREGPENQGTVRLKTPSQNDAIKFGYLSVYPGTVLQWITLLDPAPPGQGCPPMQDIF